MQKHRTHLKEIRVYPGAWNQVTPTPIPCSKCGNSLEEILVVTEQSKLRLFSNTVMGTLSRQTKRGWKNCYQSQVLSEGFLCFWLVGVHVYITKDLPTVYKDAGPGTEEGNT